MAVIRALRYVPLIALLLGAMAVAVLCMDGGRDYSDSTFVFAAQDQGQWQV